MIALHNVHLLDVGLRSLVLDGGRIAAIQPARQPNDQAAVQFHFENGLAFPGLINSHDHLDFNLFPRLGNRVYADYTEWGRDIHAVNKKEIEAVRKIPQELRTQWGLYKNLLNGVTTVVHHGESLPIKDAVINAFQRCHALHSIRLERRWRWRLNQPFRQDWPFVIHVGEGTNAESHREIDTLIKWNLFQRRLIGIHGVAMTERQAAAFAALIWCPVANYFLLNQTADIAALQQHTAILFGSDSTVTAGWNFWEHLRFARGLGRMSDDALFQAVTEMAAAVWHLGDVGKLKPGFQADLVVANRRTNLDGYDALFAVNPEDIALVMQNGEVRLCDQERYDQLRASGGGCGRFCRIALNDTIKWVQGDLPALLSEIERYAPGMALPIKVLT